MNEDKWSGKPGHLFYLLWRDMSSHLYKTSTGNEDVEKIADMVCELTMPERFILVQTILHEIMQDQETASIIGSTLNDAGEQLSDNCPITFVAAHGPAAHKLHKMINDLDLR